MLVFVPDRSGFLVWILVVRLRWTVGVHEAEQPIALQRILVRASSSWALAVVLVTAFVHDIWRSAPAPPPASRAVAIVRMASLHTLEVQAGLTHVSTASGVFPLVAARPRLVPLRYLAAGYTAGSSSCARVVTQIEVLTFRAPLVA